MKNVFLIKTPLQLLNAVEAMYQFNLCKQDCVLIVMSDRKSQHQTLKLVESMDEWSDVFVLNELSLFFNGDRKDSFMSKVWKSKLFSKSFFNVLRLNKLSQYLVEVDYMFLGHARYVYMSHFMNVTPHKHVYLLDDGNATIRLAKERSVGLEFVVAIGISKKLKFLAKQYLQGIKSKDAAHLGFFTIYDIPVSSRDHVVKNSYQHIRASLVSSEITNTVYFIGSPLSETGLIDQESYFEHLGRVREFFRDTAMVYVSHRRERREKLKIIEDIMGIKVVMFDYPIEYQLAVVGPRPNILASFFSSALDSCRLIFGKQLKVVSFKLDFEDSPHKEVIESVYKNYEMIENHNFSVEKNY